MAEQDPLYLNLDDVYDAADLGLPFRDIIGQGIVGSGDLAVSQSSPAAMTVSVAQGAAWVQGDDNASLQPTYRVYNDAAETLAIAAADPALPRHDLIIARVYDTTFGDVQDAFKLEVVTGTPNATPVDPAVPNNALVLARILVGAAVGNISTANITDLRVRGSVLTGAMGTILFSDDTGYLWASNTTENDWIHPGAVPGLFIPANTLGPNDELTIEMIAGISVASATSPTQAFKFYIDGGNYGPFPAAAFPAAGNAAMNRVPLIVEIKIRAVGITIKMRIGRVDVAAATPGVASPEWDYSWELGMAGGSAAIDVTKDHTIRWTHQMGTSNANNVAQLGSVVARRR